MKHFCALAVLQYTRKFLSDEIARNQILKIPTTRMKESQVMDPDVDIRELATMAENFSGAEIGGLVKSASSFAFNRHVKIRIIFALEYLIPNQFIG